MFLKNEIKWRGKCCFSHIAKQKKFLYRNVITCRLFADKPTCDKIIAKHTSFKTYYGFF